MYPLDPPEYPNFEDDCPNCGHEADSIEFVEMEYDGDEGGVYAYPIWQCTECGEKFSK